MRRGEAVYHSALVDCNASLDRDHQCAPLHLRASPRSNEVHEKERWRRPPATSADGGQEKVDPFRKRQEGKAGDPPAPRTVVQQDAAEACEHEQGDPDRTDRNPKAYGDSPSSMHTLTV